MRKASRARPATRHVARYVVCLSNDGYSASLERGKLYRVRRDDDAAAEGLLRVVDESGEDYLYPEAFFDDVTLSSRAARALAG